MNISIYALNIKSPCLTFLTKTYRTSFEKEPKQVEFEYIEPGYFKIVKFKGFIDFEILINNDLNNHKSILDAIVNILKDFGNLR